MLQKAFIAEAKAYNNKRRWQQLAVLQQPWILCMEAKEIPYNLLGVWSFARTFCFFLVDSFGDGVNGSDWCLAGGSWSWIKGLHQVPTVSSIFHHSWHFHVYYISSFISRMLWLMCCYCKWWDWHECCWWFIYVRVWVKGQGVDIICFLFFVMFLCCG